MAANYNGRELRKITDIAPGAGGMLKGMFTIGIARKRSHAELLGHIQNTNWQYNLPPLTKARCLTAAVVAIFGS